MRDEGPFLLEWIAHLRAIGVTDFLVFSNECSDGTDALLDAVGTFGVVHVRQNVAPGKSPQWQALNAAWRHPLRKACDWALVIDVDEFPVLHRHDTLPDLIADLPEDTDAITLPWRLFGANGKARMGDGLVTETFTRAMTPTCNFPVSATFFKTLLRPDRFQKFGVHRPKHKPRGARPVWSDGSGKRLPPSVANNDKRLSLYGLPVARDLIELNHYSVKSAESFLVKRWRGLPNRSSKQIDLAYWVERNFNTVTAPGVTRHNATMRAILKNMQDLPQIAALHDSAHAWHRAKFLELLQSESEHKLYGQLRLAANSTEVSPAESDQMVKWYQSVIG